MGVVTPEGVVLRRCGRVDLLPPTTSPPYAPLPTSRGSEVGYGRGQDEEGVLVFSLGRTLLEAGGYSKGFGTTLTSPSTTIDNHHPSPTTPTSPSTTIDNHHPSPTTPTSPTITDHHPSPSTPTSPTITDHHPSPSTLIRSALTAMTHPLPAHRLTLIDVFQVTINPPSPILRSPSVNTLRDGRGMGSSRRARERLLAKEYFHVGLAHDERRDDAEQQEEDDEDSGETRPEEFSAGQDQGSFLLMPSSHHHYHQPPPPPPPTKPPHSQPTPTPSPPPPTKPPPHLPNHPHHLQITPTTPPPTPPSP
ncbi:hypothetical protein Pcinc_043731 [Petrolisthes cinctipes]|uniref:Uncharacterized protein n=1 Tax=Petrolisthes cinctipes TaxID=88211 RepID=A0AAE1EHL2_PETCI|nr:hypothetical protein Pcinc_043731 [Petrolisthes cinctipes]